MEADLQAYVAFYLTGKKQPAQLDEIAGLGLRPALFSAYRDLTRLRYDFPLVLIDSPGDGRFAEPLSGLIDAILAKVAIGADAERIRKHVLVLEQDIRALAAGGAQGSFSALWDCAAAPLAANDALLADSLARARNNLKVDGEVVDCNANLPFHLFAHAWGATQIRRARRFSDDIKRLILKLTDILQADYVNSEAGKSPDNLRHAFGSGPMDSFDFDTMSRLLNQASPRGHLPKRRRQRIGALITALRTQRFFPMSASELGLADSAAKREAPYSFAFESCSAALKAYRERLPKAVELARAVAIAGLEIKGEYCESKHDPLFEAFGENGLDREELSLFPDYLVRLNANELDGAERNALTEILSVDLPIKIVVQTDDVIEASPIEKGHLAFTLRSRQLARLSMGMGEVFVLQAPASSLCALRPDIQRGLDYNGAALFSVFSGDSVHTAGFSPYLVGAAALEARVFPAFTFNPAAGSNWAARFSLAQNPQPEAGWSTHDFVYQDENCQSITASLPFTLLDFVACDARYARHFARVPRHNWNDSLKPADEVLAGDGRRQTESVPFLLMVDGEDRLQKVIVDEKLTREARRCRTAWNSLQELGGIHNSHAERLLESERQRWQESAQPVVAASVPGAAASTPAAQAAVAAPVEAEPERSSDEAYIETARCSSCNECVQLNGKMFGYDGNKQAFIADASAGTYAQLVEAAENCQVSIIHPGKPRNLNEPGLEELLKRAEAFV